MPELKAIAALAREIHQTQALESLLQSIVERCALLLQTERVSIRLLDASRVRLMTTYRNGEPLHANSNQDFKLGQGLLGWIAQEGKPILAEEPERDPRFLFRPDMKDSMGSFVGVPLITAEGCIGVLSAIHPQQASFGERHLDLLTIVAALSAPYIEIARLQKLSQVDPLTGALNRRGLDLFLPDDPAFSVLMVDIDHFKKVNDSYGHAVGDEVLKRVARLLSSSLRSGDAIVRYGGEEFLVILAEVGLGIAAKVAERARQKVSEHPIKVNDQEIPITISVGVAERCNDEDRDALIARADVALYKAKLAGRNKVEIAENLDPPTETSA
jgi:diguanylate cyclase (GGDEF)-like protein